MSKQKKYTAHLLRRVANYFAVGAGHDLLDRKTKLLSITKEDVAAMLRQAADAEDELAKLSESKNRWMQYQETAAGERNACIDELRKKDAEIAQLKARLSAVVMECETPITDVLVSEHDSQELFRFRDMILRAASGEGGAE